LNCAEAFVSLDIMCNFKWHELYKVDLITSPFVSTKVLYFWRCLALLWNLPAVIYILIQSWASHTDDEGKYSAPIGMTMSWLSYAFICLYLFLMIAITFKHRMLYNQASSYSYELLDREPLTRTMRLAWVMFELLFALAIMVSTLYWSLLFPKQTHGKLDWTNFHIHAANSFVMLVELLLSRMIFQSRHLLFLLLGGGVYFIFAICFQAVSGRYIYFFLDYTEPAAGYFYPLAVTAPILFFYLGMLLTRLRDRISGKPARLHQSLLSDPDAFESSLPAVGVSSAPPDPEGFVPLPHEDLEMKTFLCF